MEFAPRPPRAARENVVPLINIVFLLLIFFLLTGTLRRPDPLGIDLPRAEGELAGAPDAREIALGSDGHIALDGVRVERASLPERLGSPAPASIRVRADARARADDLLALLEIAREAGIDEIDLVTRPLR